MSWLLPTGSVLSGTVSLVTKLEVAVRTLSLVALPICPLTVHTHIYTNSLDEDEMCESPLNYINDCHYYDTHTFTEMANLTTEPFSVFCINCRCLNTNIEPLKDLLADLSNDHFQLDIIGLTETFTLKEGIDYDLDGYHPLISNSRPADDDYHGGVGVYVKRHISCKHREDISTFIPHHFESIFIEISIPKKSNIVIGVIYRPPGNDKDIFDETLNELNDILSKENKHIFLMGDFNINLLEYSNNNKVTEFVDNLLSFGQVPLILKPTRVDLNRKTATLIDNIFTNRPMSYTKAGILVTDLTDHFGVFTIIENHQQKHKPKDEYYRQISEENIIKFKNLLSQSDFSSVTSMDDPNESYSNFVKLYMKHYDNAFPLKKLQSNSKYVKKEPWITKGLLISSIKKHKLFTAKLKNPSPGTVMYKAISPIINFLTN